MKRLVAALLILGAFPASAWSAKVKVWNQAAPAQYENAEFRQAVLTNQGAIRLSRELKPLTEIDAAHVWALAEDADGNVYIATGNEGKIFKRTADGTTTVLYQDGDSQILSLAIGGDGSLYAGTGPSGRIVKLNAKGAASDFYKTGESYVWSLAVDPKAEKLYAGTGPKGRIHRIEKDGTGSVFYSTRQDHVMCVAFAADGMLYAGTGNRGLVYRIDSRGKGFVLLDAVQNEVRTLLVTDKAVFAGTSAPINRKSGGVADKTSPAGLDLGISREKPTATSDEENALDREDSSKAPPTPPGSDKAKASISETRESTAPKTPPASSKENSVYRIAYDGTVREVFREKAMVLALAYLNERLLVGTGGAGQLFEVRPFERERTELVRVDHTHVQSLLLRADGSLVLGVGDPGKLYVLRDEFTKSGSVLSEVLDAKLQSKWGSLRWNADLPKGTSLSIAVRSGNVSDPDETWSEWSAEQTESETALADAPLARFFQYRITLKTDDPKSSPTLRSLAIRYATVNIAPDVSAVEVPDLHAVALGDPKKVKIAWTASDLNGDELVYALYYRKEGWQNWIELQADLEKREYEWDTTTVPAGVYQLKVVASDRRDNSAEEAMLGERVSDRFVVDHAAPAVTVKVVGYEGDSVLVEASATDALTRLASASYALNSGKWINVFPADGLFDRKSATFKFKLNGLKPGSHVLVLRVTDAAGNTGAQDVVFEVMGK